MDACRKLLHDFAFKYRKKREVGGGVIAHRSPAQRVIVRMAPPQTLKASQAARAAFR